VLRALEKNQIKKYKTGVSQHHPKNNPKKKLKKSEPTYLVPKVGSQGVGNTKTFGFPHLGNHFYPKNLRSFFY